MKPLELMEWCAERHEYYCDLAGRFMGAHDRLFHRPCIHFVAKAVRTAARAKYAGTICEYNLTYLLAVGERYEQTIKHEIAHHIVFQLSSPGFKYAGHGEAFYLILSTVLFGRAERYHSYKYEEKHVTLAKALLQLQELKRLEAQEQLDLDVDAGMRQRLGNMILGDEFAVNLNTVVRVMDIKYDGAKATIHYFVVINGTIKTDGTWKGRMAA